MVAPKKTLRLRLSPVCSTSQIKLHPCGLPVHLLRQGRKDATSFSRSADSDAAITSSQSEATPSHAFPLSDYGERDHSCPYRATAYLIPFQLMSNILEIMEAFYVMTLWKCRYLASLTRKHLLGNHRHILKPIILRYVTTPTRTWPA